MTAPQLTKPPTTQDMVKITLSMAFVSLIAAVILSGIFYITEPIKLKNVQARELRMISGLLGLSATAEVHEVRRYLPTSGDLQIIYVTSDNFLRLDAHGTELERTELPATMKQDTSPEDKDRWVMKHMISTTGHKTNYVGRFFIGKEQEQIAGYVVEAVTIGYKAKIRFFVALDKTFQILGIDIIEHEEDPGLGAEISENYFKNQFAGRTQESIATLEVTKDPLPPNWKQALDELGIFSFDQWIQKHSELLNQHPAIYAITGATISSKAVTDGLKRAIRNFRIRLNTLKEVL